MKLRVTWKGLKEGIELKTGERHVLVVVRPKGYQLELEESFFHSASAVFLPDVTPENGTPDSAEFSNDELWNDLREWNKAYADDLWKTPFDPPDDPSRTAGTALLLTVLRFVQKNPSLKLIIAGHTDREGSADYNLSFVFEAHPCIGYGEDYPKDPSAADGTRSQSDRRVDLLLFGPPLLPDFTSTKNAGEDIYRHRRIPLTELIPEKGEEGDAIPETGASPPESHRSPPLTTTMILADPVDDPNNPWAFVDAFDAASLSGRLGSGDGEGANSG